ncbi:hypothetical protein BCV70DRAFT_1702 [Testicularia cyperi]|uniref:Homeobox domain-containing protein n=1 Tax=Testicularia cyperi TaxID=1882483 RepID=A0A317XW47_9BASI|nr:hypothetical protein BCV70DRAFT_1702 [Testicularia cyperi]
MVSSLSARPVSSVRDQQTSPALSSLGSTPLLGSRSHPSVPASASASISEPLRRSAGAASELSNRSPLLDDRQSSPGAGSLRSSELSHDRSSIYSFGHRSASTALTAPSIDGDRLPPISTLDFAKHSRHPTFDSQTRWLDSKMSGGEKDQSTSSRRSPAPPMLPSIQPASSTPLNGARRPGSPAGRMSNHSAEWDMHSDRGSPRIGGARFAARPITTAGSSAGPHAYPSDYPASPRSASGRPVEAYRDGAYLRDAHAPYAQDRESSPALSSRKRKASLSSDLPPPSRAPLDRMERAGGRVWTDDYPARGDYYGASDRAYYRGHADRADAAERGYAGSYGASRDAAYAHRYSGHDEEPGYSPHRLRASSPAARAEYATAAAGPGRGGYGYDAPPPPASNPSAGYASRRPDRFSPVSSARSPPYASRPGPPGVSASYDPYGRGPPHSSYGGRGPSPAPYGAEGRPQLPPLSSRPMPGGGPAGGYGPGPGAARGRYTPPLGDAGPPLRRSLSPEVHADYPEPFYPDRRLYFARERITDPEMDAYYASGAHLKPRYADPGYDHHYGGPHARAYSAGAGPMSKNGTGPLPPMVPPPPGHMGMRPMDGPGAYPPGPYGEYPGHGPRDLHGGMVGDPRGGPVRPLLAVPATHVPPGPSAGIAPPPRRRGKLPKPVTDLLKTWLLEHAAHPYPTEDEKRSLCSMTGLTLSQVSNWFINARRRILLPSGANGSPNGSATAAQVKAAFSADSSSPPPHDV